MQQTLLPQDAGERCLPPVRSNKAAQKIMELKTKEKAIAAMSGGVDSSVAAYLALQQGYDCIGVTLKLYGGEGNTCCSLNDTEDARSVAFKLGIPFYAFNFQLEFDEKIIKKFVRSYECGETPNPCIDCNRFMKFGKLFERAQELDYDYIVTGHYARIEKHNDRFLLRKPADSDKDQTYVLYAMTQEQLAHTLFPLADLQKSQVREIAESLGFVNAKKPDSQDICFVPSGDYGSFLEHYSGKTYLPGNFTDKNGNIIGKHKGITKYTIGQRKGLGLSSSEPMYVVQKCPETNSIVLGASRDLFRKSLEAEDINLIAADSIPCPMRVKAKIRYGRGEADATVEQIAEDRIHLKFDEPQRAITPGQAVVLYDGDYVLGGGTIK